MKIQNKEGFENPVTEADYKAQYYIYRKMKKFLPDVKIVGFISYHFFKPIFSIFER